MQKIDLTKSRSIKDFKVGDEIRVSDNMQKGYKYILQEKVGKNFHEDFTPELSPAQMLKYGVFEGKYLNDCYKEFPREWFEGAIKKLSPAKPDISKNRFKIKSRQSLKVWKRKGWILPEDPDVRGWFQWYCRYYIGRRDEVLDSRQIKRWRAFNRHKAQVLKNCEKKDLKCRPKQRQALLQWAYNPFI
ncbi:hypothetical protein GF354_03400 [Candidatus Peregrinibacteria bacterium]|nr:hypothetical protein [Candidatus Peregrinibacteria bacterium]